MSTYPALDFLRKVEIWQSAPGGTAGLAVIMPEGDKTTLAGLLAQVRHSGPTTLLEAKARYWLIGYREANPPLTTDQESELDEAIHGSISAHEPVRQGYRREQRHRPVPRLAYVIVALIIALGASLSIASLLIGNGSGSPPPAGPAVAAPQQPAQGPLTDLQQFRADWNVPRSATADAGNPDRLVLLQDGLYYPVLWSIPAGDPGWVTDSTGSVTASVHGGDADVTDSGGTTYTITAGQPFVLASNPQVVFRVLHDATIQSMPPPHAIRVRHRL